MAMPGLPYRNLTRFVALACETLLILVALDSFRLMLSFPPEIQPVNFENPQIWLPWYVGWTLIRYATTVSALFVNRPWLWFVPLIAALWETMFFSSAWRSASQFAAAMHYQELFYLNVIAGFILHPPVRNIVWPMILPLVVIPAIGLNLYRLVVASIRRHAA